SIAIMTENGGQGGGELPKTVLNSITKEGGFDETIWGNESLDGPPPLNDWNTIGSRALKHMTTGHQSNDLPSIKEPATRDECSSFCSKLQRGAAPDSWRRRLLGGCLAFDFHSCSSLDTRNAGSDSPPRPRPIVWRWSGAFRAARGIPCACENRVVL